MFHMQPGNIEVSMRVKYVHNNIHKTIIYLKIIGLYFIRISENFEEIYIFFQYDETLKPSYISVDLSEVELAEYDGPSTPPNNSLLLDVSSMCACVCSYYFITIVMYNNK